MKNKFILWMLALLASAPAQSCEICGCGNSNFQIGLLPSFNQGFVSLRYGYSRFNSRVAGSPDEYSRDYYHSVELWGGFQFNRVQVMSFMPYLQSTKFTDDGNTSSRGPGDVLILVNYRLYQSARLIRNESRTLRQLIYLGSGVKLPTGTNRVNPASADFNIGDFNSQAGTGSVDYLFNATHNLSWNRSGVVTNLVYRVNSTNAQGYRFGNRTYANLSYFYSFNLKDYKLKPNVGFNYQSNSVNTFSGSEVENSNGYSLNSTLGLNLLRNKVGLNATWFMPVSQDMYAGQTKITNRILVGVTYSF